MDGTLARLAKNISKDSSVRNAQRASQCSFFILRFLGVPDA
eukprot:CAMPEP_0116032860 /NCGR_PEP_ID=MMETSP0321-20121206/18499_1 /TAXON_ID=163516 /ORGANISM="Leptocylindrus danicus var. danicus, Strain B650" /LENGTH=40 /DNA_ID= /DNA_START= /DNA_END= /DNA_ORIENTATION=